LVRFELFGFDRAVLWGSIAAFGALIPGVGTSIVFIPTVIYLILSGSYFLAGGMALWGMLAVGFIDNLLGPYLIGRKSNLHPFFILISVLGGISLLGPIGFILGPVSMSLFVVLMELYGLHVAGIKIHKENVPL
jgi:predicted PurR-regulated permease PerM